MTSTLVVIAETTDPVKQQQLISGALPIAGLFVLVLGIALFFLWRSLNKQIGRIDADLPSGPDAAEQARDRELTAEAVARGEEQDPATGSDADGTTSPVQPPGG